MTYPEKLRWLADHDGAEIEVEGPIVWCLLNDLHSLIDVRIWELRLSRAEADNRNPGYFVTSWVGREFNMGLEVGMRYFDGWLLRKKVEEVISKHMSCLNCGRKSKLCSPEICASLNNCHNFSEWIAESKLILNTEELKAELFAQGIRASEEIIKQSLQTPKSKPEEKKSCLDCESFGDCTENWDACLYHSKFKRKSKPEEKKKPATLEDVKEVVREMEAKPEENKSCTNCIREMVSCLSLNPPCKALSRWERKPEEKKPVVKAWVRWVTSGLGVNKIYGCSWLVTGLNDNEVKLNENWHNVKVLIKDGCEHTDTPNDEASWTKIGG